MGQYVILAQIKTDMPRPDFVETLQFAFDGGAAGWFQTRLMPGGFEVAFLRDSGEDIAAGARCTVEQLALEIEEADAPPEDTIDVALASFAADIRRTGWIPFPPTA